MALLNLSQLTLPCVSLKKLVDARFNATPSSVRQKYYLVIELAPPILVFIKPVLLSLSIDGAAKLYDMQFHLVSCKDTNWLCYQHTDVATFFWFYTKEIPWLRNREFRVSKYLSSVDKNDWLWLQMSDKRVIGLSEVILPGFWVPTLPGGDDFLHDQLLESDIVPFPILSQYQIE